MSADTQHYLAELCGRAAFRSMPLFSRFLNLTEQKWAGIEAKKAGCCLKLFGGAPDAERRMLAVCAESAPDDAEFPIDCLKISPKSMKFASPIAHRDVLGALMGLGIEREMLGDIAIDGNCAYVFCVRSISPLIRESITQVCRCDVKIALSDPPGIPLHQTKEVLLRLTSLRLDSLCAAMYHLSRGDAQELIRKGLVNVDDEPCLKCDYTPLDGQVISVRGQGRFRLKGMDGKTKKNKEIIQAEQYI